MGKLLHATILDKYRPDNSEAEVRWVGQGLGGGGSPLTLLSKSAPSGFALAAEFRDAQKRWHSVFSMSPLSHACTHTHLLPTITY